MNGRKARGIMMKISGFDMINVKPLGRLQFVCLVLLALLVPALNAGSYTLSWSTIDGGGPYVLTGAIDQPDVDRSSGGHFDLLGVFWACGPLCMVEFDDFARLAENWLNSSSALPGDIDSDHDVEFDDLSWLADYWLSLCPYNWPLR
jgi:hypothetical protein